MHVLDNLLSHRANLALQDCPVDLVTAHIEQFYTLHSI